MTEEIENILLLRIKFWSGRNRSAEREPFYLKGHGKGPLGETIFARLELEQPANK